MQARDDEKRKDSKGMACTHKRLHLSDLLFQNLYHKSPICRNVEVEAINYVLRSFRSDSEVTDEPGQLNLLQKYDSMEA